MPYVSIVRSTLRWVKIKASTSAGYAYVKINDISNRYFEVSIKWQGIPNGRIFSIVRADKTPKEEKSSHD
jgi:hypothetical protein